MSVAEVYMTVQGRSKDATHAIAESDAHLGVESGKEWLDGFTPKFVDYPFTDPDADVWDHLDVVAETQPTLTVAPDIEHGRDPDAVYLVADRLAQYADTVIIVPKDTHPSTVPERFRVGVPAAKFGSSAPWTVWDYRDCGPVHILGGGPALQLRFRNYLPVASVDTATLGKCCRFGWWDETSKDAPNGWDFRKRLRESLNNYAAAWTA